MNYGGGGIAFVNNQQAGGGGAPVTNMRNGLSLVGTFGELGLNPLLHNSFVDVAGFDLEMSDAATFFGWKIDRTNSVFLLGSTENFNGASVTPQIKVDTVNQEIDLGLPSPSPFGGNRYFQWSNPQTTVSFGDLDNHFVNQFIAQMNYATEQFFIGRSTATHFNVDVGGNTYELGDLSHFNNGLRLSINDGANNILMRNNVGNFLQINPGAGVYEIGDNNGTANGNRFNISDSVSSYEMANGANSFFKIDGNAGTSRLGMLGGTGQGFNFSIDDSTRSATMADNTGTYFIIDAGVTNRYQFGDVSGANNGTHILINDGTGTLDFVTTTANLFRSDSNGITILPSAGGVSWILKDVTVAASVLDATQFLNVTVNGVNYKLALIQ